MFDGSISVPKSGDETSEDVRLHISLLVDIWKKEGCEALEFVCSAWPDSLEVQNVYVFRRERLQSLRPYMGPNIKYVISLYASLLIWSNFIFGIRLQLILVSFSDTCFVVCFVVFQLGFKFLFIMIVFRDLNSKLHVGLYEFLKRRGINDELSVFLHNYMMNKDRTELIQWLRKIKSFMEEWRHVSFCMPIELVFL